jgi:pimeloyl-ACP methyl ester carboxylesterase
MKPTKIMFLPGAGGDKRFWLPASNLINHSAQREFIEWPGIAEAKEDSSIRCFNDLVISVTDKINQPCAIIAQSMGGVVGALALLKQQELITHLILVVTSGGINVSDIHPENWRTAYKEANPSYPGWFTNYTGDLTDKLRKITIPVLLIWGDCDPISPLAIGERLDSIFSNSQLEIIKGGDHALAHNHPEAVGLLIQKHLNKVR